MQSAKRSNIFTAFASTVLFGFVIKHCEPAEVTTCSAMSATKSPFLAVLSHHIKRNPYAGYFTMATVENGKPRARTVLFQGLAEQNDGSVGICIKTHKRSNKIVRSDSLATEIVWWMEQTSVQFRFSGNINYSDEEQRLRVWKALNPAAKSQFFYNPPAGSSLDISTRGPIFQDEQMKATEDGLNGAPPETFVVGVLVPDEVDFLDLNTLKRSNWKYVKDNNESCSFKWIEKSGYAPPVISSS